MHFVWHRFDLWEIVMTVQSNGKYRNNFNFVTFSFIYVFRFICDLKVKSLSWHIFWRFQLYVYRLICDLKVKSLSWHIFWRFQLYVYRLICDLKVKSLSWHTFCDVFSYMFIGPLDHISTYKHITENVRKCVNLNFSPLDHISTYKHITENVRKCVST